MIDKNQWIKFYNLDTENLKEVFNFIDFRVDVRRLFPKCKWGKVCGHNAFNPLVEEAIWSMAKKSQDYLRTEQRKFRQLVDIWLKEIEPILKKWPQETVTDTAILEVDEAISAEQDKEFRLKPLKLKPLMRLEKQAKGKISAFINKINSIASNFKHWKVGIDAYGKLKMVNYTQELDDTQMMEWDYITGSNKIDITGNSYITNLIINIFTDFVNTIIDGSQIQRCKKDSCENIFLKLGNQKYCSEHSNSKTYNENDRESKREIRGTYEKREILCDLIELWLKLSEDETWLKKVAENEWMTVSKLKEDLKGEREWIEAKDLAQILENIVEYEGEHYNNVEITFLNAGSLGQRLPTVIEKLKERNIDMVIEPGSQRSRYCFTRIQ